MKAHDYLIIIIVSFFVFVNLNCEKATAPIEHPDQRIFGAWNWIESAGGDIVYTILTPPPVIHVFFNADGIQSIYQNDSLIETDSFSIYRDKPFSNADTADLIKFYQGPIYNIRINPHGLKADSVIVGYYKDIKTYRIDNDTLWIMDLGYGGFIRKYCKL